MIWRYHCVCDHHGWLPGSEESTDLLARDPACSGSAGVFAAAFGGQQYQRSDLHVPRAANTASPNKRRDTLVRIE